MRIPGRRLWRTDNPVCPPLPTRTDVRIWSAAACCRSGFDDAERQQAAAVRMASREAGSALSPQGSGSDLYNVHVSRQARILFLLVAFGLVACGGREHTGSQQQAAAEDESKPSDGGTVIRRLPADVSTLNPILSTSKYDRWVFFYLYVPLTHFDANLQVAPGLAKSWEISPDGKIYTFHVDPKATFDDGTPVLASDVIWSLKKITDPASEAVQLAGHFDNVDWAQTKAADAKTAVIAF